MITVKGYTMRGGGWDYFKRVCCPAKRGRDTLATLNIRGFRVEMK